MTTIRTMYIKSQLGFKQGSLPFTYLGVPLFVRRPHVRHLRPISDCIRSKMLSCKYSLLSIMGRIHFIKSIINGIMLYSFYIYSWPRKLLKEIDSWIQNFVWTNNSIQRKLYMMKWKQVWSSLKEGGLGVFSLLKNVVGVFSQSEIYKKQITSHHLQIVFSLTLS